MSMRPAGLEDQKLTVAARRVLLDALVALRDHAAGVIVVGAQAIYIRADLAGLAALASFTSDADLSLDPRRLVADPRLEAALREAGFTIAQVPGTWSRSEVVGDGRAEIAVDLLVAETLGGTSRNHRSAQLPPHGRQVARKVSGLEAAVVDNDWVTVNSLEPERERQGVRAQVAGVAALLMAKAYKLQDRIRDRERRPDRLNNKDAADVIRLMQLPGVASVADRFHTLLDDPETVAVAREGLTLLRAQFGAAQTLGTAMAISGLGGTLPDRTIRAIGPAFLEQMPGA